MKYELTVGQCAHGKFELAAAGADLLGAHTHEITVTTKRRDGSETKDDGSSSGRADSPQCRLVRWPICDYQASFSDSLDGSFTELSYQFRPESS